MSLSQISSEDSDKIGNVLAETIPCKRKEYQNGLQNKAVLFSVPNKSLERNADVNDFLYFATLDIKK